METVKVNKNAYSKGLRRALKAIENGGIIIIPTETVYGIAALASDKNAVRKIYEAKGRDFKKPLPLISSSVKGLKGWAVLGDRAKIVGESFWPGPLTMVVPKGKKTPDIVTAGKDKIAVRVPKHYFIKELIESLGNPLVATSANISGEEEPLQCSEINPLLLEKVSLCIDGGHTLYEQASTVIDMTQEQMPILRPGPITGKQIVEALKNG